MELFFCGKNIYSSKLILLSSRETVIGSKKFYKNVENYLWGEDQIILVKSQALKMQLF